MSVPTTVVDEKTGEEKKRLINKARWKGYGPTSVSFVEKGVEHFIFLPVVMAFSESNVSFLGDKGAYQTPIERRGSTQPVRSDACSAVRRGRCPIISIVYQN